MEDSPRKVRRFTGYNPPVADGDPRRDSSSRYPVHSNQETTVTPANQADSTAHCIRQESDSFRVPHSPVTNRDFSYQPSPSPRRPTGSYTTPKRPKSPSTDQNDTFDGRPYKKFRGDRGMSRSHFNSGRGDSDSYQREYRAPQSTESLPRHPQASSPAPTISSSYSPSFQRNSPRFRGGPGSTYGYSGQLERRKHMPQDTRRNIDGSSSKKQAHSWSSKIASTTSEPKAPYRPKPTVNQVSSELVGGERLREYVGRCKSWTKEIETAAFDIPGLRGKDNFVEIIKKDIEKFSKSDIESNAIIGFLGEEDSGKADIPTWDRVWNQAYAV
ncbi:hypothetical protein ABW21_db0205196 [Orbilia brochopaga]|nr:hypothetical protein ABW21_db0205196 [Drechslerella brochopaga]